MTLDTRVYVQGRIDYREVFVKCNQLIGAHEGIKFTDEPVADWKDGERIPGPEDGEWTIWNKPGQGLCALLDISYRRADPLREADEHAKYCDGDTDDCFAPCGVPCWLEVSFDTAYGYKGDGGEGCGDLHARLVAELGQWLDGKGIRWQWRNEFTSEVHSGYERLIDLCSSGFEASAWFRTTVAPAIAAMGGEIT
jgi:hypothetical protein